MVIHKLLTVFKLHSQCFKYQMFTLSGLKKCNKEKNPFTFYFKKISFYLKNIGISFKKFGRFSWFGFAPGEMEKTLNLISSQ